MFIIIALEESSKRKKIAQKKKGKLFLMILAIGNGNIGSKNLLNYFKLVWSTSKRHSLSVNSLRVFVEV